MLPAVLERLLGFAAMVFVLALLWRVARPRLDALVLGRLFRAGLVLLVYAAVSVTVLGIFMERWGLQGDHPGRGLDALVEHRGEKPFIYRVLAPELVGRIARALEAAPVDEAWWVERSPLARYRRPGERWDAAKARRFHAAYGLLFASLLAALFAARALTRAALRPPPVYADFGPAIGGLLLPLTFLRSGYLYDFPDLAFVFGCTAAAAAGRRRLFYPLFVLACLDKESDVLLVAAFAAFAVGEIPTRRLLAHLGALAGLGAAVVLGLRVVFADAPGEAGWFFLPANVLWLLNPRPYFRFFEAYGPLVPFPRSVNLALLFGVGFAVLRRWSRKPVAVRRLLVYTAVPLLPLYALFGFTDEIRALAPLFPGIYLAGLHTVQTLYERDLVS